MKPIEEIVTNTCPKPNNNNNSNTLERKLARPQKEQALNCPRCNSTNTKFCYYNNYSLTQPRYFCKTCRRYWTEGGSLRNIPVGGGSRKNKRSSSSSLSSQSTTTITNSSSSAKAMTTKLPDLIIHPSNSTTTTTQAQKIMMINQGQDLNLGFPSSITSTHHHHHQDFRNISDLVQLPSLESNNKNSANNNNHISALELLTGLTSRGFNSFMPMPVLVPDHHHHQHPNTVYGNTTTTSTSTTTTTNNTSSGFSLIPHEFKPSLNFSLDGLGSGNGGYESLQGVQEGSGTATNGRLLFPFEDLKQVSAGSNGIDHNNKDQGDSANGYWTGMLGGGSW